MKFKRLKIIINLTVSMMISNLVFLYNPMITSAETTQNEVNNNKNYSDNIYGIGSISKVFTTTAVMILVDRGEINLDAPLTDYIKDFKMADDRYKNITPRMLLNHSSGIRGTHYNNIMLFGDNDTSAHDLFLSELACESLKSDPGEYSVYCNDGFTLAEILVERVSKLSFTEFIKENISEPLSMNHTMTPLSDNKSFEFAKIYSTVNNMELPTENSNIIGAGGIYSTSEDLCRFSSMFMDNSPYNVLSKESIKAMEDSNENKTMIDYKIKDSNINYGLGWDSVNAYPFNECKIKALSKGGTTNSFHSNITVLPEKNMSVSVISSGGNGFEDLVSQQILSVLLEEQGESVTNDFSKSNDLNTETKKIPEDILKYEGLYMGQNEFKVEFEGNEKMYLSSLAAETNIKQEYVYNSNGDFVSKDGEYISDGTLKYNYSGIKGRSILRFVTGENGKEYIVSSSYEDYPGLGERAESEPIAEKIESNNISDNVEHEWIKRDNKRYYIVNGKYNSTNYVYNCSYKLKYSDESRGYVGNTKIIDENAAKAFIKIPIMVGRDWQDLFLYKKDNIEYLQKGDNIYICEDGIDNIRSINGNVKIESDKYAKWYNVDADDIGKEIVINKPEYGSFYVYDENNNCINSSIAVNGNNKVILPKNGKIAFVGEANAEFKVNIK